MREPGTRTLRTARGGQLGHGRRLPLGHHQPCPRAAQCIDPFHVIKLANTAVDKTRSHETNRARHGWTPPPKRPVGRPAVDTPPRQPDPGRQIKGTRWALLKDPQHLSRSQQQILIRLRKQRSMLYRAWRLKQDLRDLYRLPRPRPSRRAPRPMARLACRSRIPAFLTLSRTIRQHKRDPRRNQPQPIQLQTRRYRLQDPSHQPPRLRPPHSRRPHLDDLPLLRRHHHRTTH